MSPYTPLWGHEPPGTITPLELALRRTARAAEKAAKPEKARSTPVPTNGSSSANVLRPSGFDDVIGQHEVVRSMRLFVTTAREKGRVLDHVLFVGPSGTGKTTFANVLANELGVACYQLEAPVSSDTLLDLAGVMQTGDILFLDEIHQQSLGDRRGRSASTQPEVLFSIMEDRTMPTAAGIIDFPHITIIGATTDPGMLPTPFINRFPIQPRFEPYTPEDMGAIGRMNAGSLGLRVTPAALDIFVHACRAVPREMNNFMRNADSLTDVLVTERLALQILDLAGVSRDGLTRDMQSMLVFLYAKARRVNGQGEVRYQASVGSVATGIGLARDQKAVQLHVEPELIRRGYVQVLHGGRALTDAGIARAQQLLED